jgi:VIT1/CCC1 family predicted Fe2+/Mn2+ transporter
MNKTMELTEKQKFEKKKKVMEEIKNYLKSEFSSHIEDALENHVGLSRGELLVIAHEAFHDLLLGNIENTKKEINTAQRYIEEAQIHLTEKREFLIKIESFLAKYI